MVRAGRDRKNLAAPIVATGRGATLMVSILGMFQRWNVMPAAEYDRMGSCEIMRLSWRGFGRCRARMV